MGRVRDGTTQNLSATGIYRGGLPSLTMRTNTHALDRLNTRLTADERSEAIMNIKAAVEVVGRDVSMAVYAVRLNAHRDSSCDSKSNGENVVAIVRNGVVKTVMLRRDNQPRTRTALRVDKVLNMTRGA